MNGLKNKIALITGGSRGLGRNTALALARHGADIIVTYHSKKEEGEAVVAEIEKAGSKAALLKFDVGNVGQFDGFASAVREVLKKHWQRESIDFLVNNAGIGISAPIAEMKETDFDTLVNIHFKGVFFLTQKLLPLIADGGRIVNFSTGLTRFAFPGYAAYAAMKGAVEVLTRYLAKELGSRHISVNSVAPGAIETDFGGGLLRDNVELNKHIAGLTALGRVGLPDDIGGVVTFLCSEEGRWVNGQRLEVSGGIYL